MKRRKFIGILAVVALLLGLIGWFFGLKKKRQIAHVYEPHVLSNICNREKMIEIGQKYRAISSENDKESLARLLDFENQDDLKQYFEQRVKQDFENNDTVLIDGWLLSITEARQCALLSLQSN